MNTYTYDTLSPFIVYRFGEEKSLKKGKRSQNAEIGNWKLENRK
jgi:hypothetical protein